MILFPFSSIPPGLRRSIFECLEIQDSLKLLKVDRQTRTQILHRGPIPKKIAQVNFQFFDDPGCFTMDTVDARKMTFTLKINLRINRTQMQIASNGLRVSGKKFIKTRNSAHFLKSIRSVKDFDMRLWSMEFEFTELSKLLEDMLNDGQLFPMLKNIYNLQMDGPNPVVKPLFLRFEPKVFGSIEFETAFLEEDWLEFFETEKLNDSRVFLVKYGQKIHKFLAMTKTELILDRDNIIQPSQTHENIEFELHDDGFGEKLEFYLRTDQISKFEHPAVIFQGILPVFRMRNGEFDAIAAKMKDQISALILDFEEISEESPEALKITEFFSTLPETFPGIHIKSGNYQAEDWEFPENDQKRWFLRRSITPEKESICLISINEITVQEIIQMQILIKFFETEQ